jgi:tetratricopeptide (TPR) repeat protein
VRGTGELAADGRVLSPYQFSHALFQQYLYQQLDPAERRRLHGEVARALEALRPTQLDALSVPLARHFEEARLLPAAVDYLRRAGERAMQLAALPEAVRLFRQGVALLNNLPAAPARSEQELRLQLLLGEAHTKAGPVADALAGFQRAAALAQALGSPAALARAALGLEEASWRFNLPMDAALQRLRSALAALGPDEPVLRVRLQVSLARASFATTAPEQFAGLSQEALDLARQAGDPVALFNALHIQIWVDRRPERSAARLAAMDEMARGAEAVGDYERLYDTFGWRVQEQLELGAVEALQADYDTLLRLSRRLRQPFHEYWPMCMQTILSLMDGRFDEAERLAVRTLQVGRQLRVESVEGMFGIQMFTLRREQGRLAEVAPLVRQFEAQHAGAAVWRPGLALIYCELGLLAEARRLFEALAVDDFAALPRDALWAGCLAYLADVCAELGAADSAAVLYRLLRPYTGRQIVAGFLCVCYGAADHYLGRLAATLGEWPPAEKHFEAALVMNRRSEAWPWLAHTQQHYAAMLLARGGASDRERAGRLLADALATARRLGMPALAARVTADQRQLANPEG